MSVRTTTRESKVALFDSVTGWAFGPTFDTADEADDFLEWFGHAEGWAADDPRDLRDPVLARAHSRWAKQRLDPETGELLAPPRRDP